jgi:hypothetical protein
MASGAGQYRTACEQMGFPISPALGRKRPTQIDPFRGSVAPPPPSAERAFRTRVRDQRLTAGGSSRVLRLSSLGTSAPLCWRPTTSSGMRTEHFTEREVSTLLRPLRSSASCEKGRPHSGSRWSADTEGAGGSTPPAPTTPAVSRAFADRLVRLMDADR